MPDDEHPKSPVPYEADRDEVIMDTAMEFARYSVAQVGVDLGDYHEVVRKVDPDNTATEIERTVPAEDFYELVARCWLVLYEQAQEKRQPKDDEPSYPVTGDPYVYVATSGGFVKVGTAKNIARRIATLRGGSPWPIRLVCATPGDHVLERTVHDALADYRIHHEWFLDCPATRDVLARYIPGFG